MSSCIIRRTRDPYADKIQYVAQYKATTNRLDMCNMPFGRPGQRFLVRLISQGK